MSFSFHVFGRSSHYFYIAIKSVSRRISVFAQEIKSAKDVKLYFYRFLFLLPLFLEHPVVIKRESSNNGSCSPVWHCSLDCCFFLNIVIFFMSVQCLRQLDMAGSRQSKHMAIPRWRATGRESMSLESLGSWVIIMMSLLLLLLTYVLF